MSLNINIWGCVLDESGTGTDVAKCSRKVASGRRVAGAIRSLVKARDLQLECAIVFRETLLVAILMYGSDTVLWKEERSRVGAVEMDNLRGLLSIRSPECTDKRVVRSEEGSR